MTHEAYSIIGTQSNIVIIADHASNYVPDDIDLGICPSLLNQHMAIDIGVAGVAGCMSNILPSQAILGGVSRLVIDYNREEYAKGLIPLESDGHEIPGNIQADREARISRFYNPYHDAVTALLDDITDGEDKTTPFILSLHSFTPGLSSRPDEARPWDIGILYNQDDRAARLAIPMLQALGLCVGDQLPYSGTILNATMNRHAEARNIPYLGVEIRQDHIGDAAGQKLWAERLAPVVRYCANALC